MATLKDPLVEGVLRYKRKYYLNLLIRGFLIVWIMVVGTFLIFNTAEYFGRFSTSVRSLLFFCFITVTLISLVYWVIEPLLRLLKLRAPLTDEQAALQIGKHFKDIDDKLLNTLQLKKMTASSHHNELLQASIRQKTSELSVFSFPQAIDLGENRRYLRYALPLALLILLLLWIGGAKFFWEPSQRIYRYNETFAEEAPFSFVLNNKKLQAFKNEDFKVELKLSGNTLPAEVYLMNNGVKLKMLRDAKTGAFYHTFSRIQESQKFNFEASGFNSDTYEVEVLERPALLSFNANLVYPAYLKKASESLKNIGNLLVPEGTQIQWKFNTQQADSLFINFEKENKRIVATKASDKTFTVSKTLKTSQNYSIQLKNPYSTNKGEIIYSVNVIADQYPRINMDTYRDTSLYNFISVGGSVSDDHGLSRLSFFYRVIYPEGKAQDNFKAINLAIQPSQKAQNFYYELDIRSLNLEPEQKIEYFSQIWDNDGVNGAKSSKTSLYTFQIPSEQALNEEASKIAQQTEQQIDKTLQQARELKKQLEDTESKLKTKRSLDFNDRRELEKILQKKQELEKNIEQLKELNQLSNQKNERFNEQNPDIKEKLDKLDKLMNELLDEETKKLYEELEKLLEQNKNSQNVNDLLQKLQNKEENLEKELERAVEMFKQMQYDQELDKLTKDLDQLSEQQKKLSEQTEQTPKNDEQKNQELQQEQNELNEKFDDLKKELEDLNKLNEELENPRQEMDMQNEQQEIDKQQEQSSQQLQNKQNKKASESQKKAAQKMKEMSQKMEQMQENMEMEQMQENLDDLRDILENLITLSFGQEQLMKDFRGVNLSDPRFIELGQKQVKLMDDSKIIEDSLYALAKRVTQIESFITREVSEMKRHMEESSQAIRERKLSLTGAKQQMAMTSINNLALMFNDVLQQMQQAMQNAQQSQSGKKKSMGKSQNLSQLQQQLSQQIEQLRKSGKTGSQLSEELAKLAIRQEALRRMLQEMKQKGNFDKDGKSLREQMDQIQKQMEENEKDLVNKKINEQLIERQKEINTRLLEVEKSMRERELDEKRKGETAKPLTKTVPKNLEKYLRNREKQLEMLRTPPPALSPYYKKEVDKYFKKIER